jgi:hypothetical protein
MDDALEPGLGIAELHRATVASHLVRLVGRLERSDLLRRELELGGGERLIEVGELHVDDAPM